MDLTHLIPLSVRYFRTFPDPGKTWQLSFLMFFIHSYRNATRFRMAFLYFKE